MRFVVLVAWLWVCVGVGGATITLNFTAPGDFIVNGMRFSWRQGTNAVKDNASELAINGTGYDTDYGYHTYVPWTRNVTLAINISYVFIVRRSLNSGLTHFGNIPVYVGPGGQTGGVVNASGTTFGDISTWAISYSGGASIPQYMWGADITNQSVLTQTYRVSMNFTNGLSTNWVFDVGPGGVLNLDLQHTNAFTATAEIYSPGAGINMADLWNVETGLPPVTSTNVGSPPDPVFDFDNGSANVWTDGNAGLLGSLPSPITATSAGTRGTNYADAAQATATADANSEKRFSELGSFLVAQDARSAQRAAIQSAQLLQGMDRVRDAVLGVGAGISGILTNGASDGYLPGGTGPSNGVTMGGLTGALQSLAPGWTPPTNVGEFKVAIPLASLDARLVDAEIDFTGATLGPYVAMFRAFVLVVVTVLFFLSSLRLVGILGGPTA